VYAGVRIPTGMKVLGIDASLRATGLGVVAERAGRLVPLESATVYNPPARLHSECLRHVQESMRTIIRRAEPQAAALEGGFFFKNARTALVLGEVRGVIIAECAAAGIPVYEYAPRSVKQSLTGFGAAGKEQMGRMIMSILGLRELPPEDEADAYAVAICHLQERSGIADLRAKPI